jgi:hypothetical protein
MLMALDREQRLAYVIDTVFDLDSREAASVIGISPEAYRQRLSRARSRLDAFMSKACGLANSEAACRCERQLPAIRHLAKVRAPDSGAVMALHKPELDEAVRQRSCARIQTTGRRRRSAPPYWPCSDRRVSCSASNPNETAGRGRRTRRIADC